jgi:hypothetical protein
MISPVTSHSARVTLELRAAGQRIPLAQMAHDFVIPVESVELPPCEAEILMTIDGKPTQMRVSLHEGSKIGRRRIALSKAADTIHAP